MLTISDSQRRPTLFGNPSTGEQLLVLVNYDGWALVREADGMKPFVKSMADIRRDWKRVEVESIHSGSSYCSPGSSGKD